MMHVKRTIFNRPPEGDLGRKQHPFQLIRLRTYQLIVELPNNLCNNGTVTQCFLKKFVLVPLILYVFLPSKKLIQDFKINTRILSEIVFCFFKFEKFKTRKKMPTTLPYSILHIVQAYRTTRFAYQKKTPHCTSSSLRISNL